MHMSSSLKKGDLKSKGVQLTHENLKSVHFGSYKSLVDGGESLTSNAMLFKKTKNGMLTEHKPTLLGLDVGKFKRRLVGNYKTQPYGYKT